MAVLARCYAGPHPCPSREGMGYAVRGGGSVDLFILLLAYGSRDLVDLVDYFRPRQPSPPGRGGPEGVGVGKGAAWRENPYGVTLSCWCFVVFAIERKPLRGRFVSWPFRTFAIERQPLRGIVLRR